MLSTIKGFFASVFAAVQLMLMIFGLAPLSTEPVSYGGGTYTAPVIEKWVPITQDGTSGYTILISANAIASEIEAAAQLQKYMYDISGAQLPIRTDAEKTDGALEIRLGKTVHWNDALQARYDALSEEGYVKLVQGETVYIFGKGQRGTIYGISGFLEEELGCRFFTAEYYYVPQNASIQINAALDDTENPALEYRSVLWKVGFKSTEWKMFNKVNDSFGNTIPEKYGNGYNYIAFCHTMSDFVPDALFEMHPEYFSYRKKEDARTLKQRCLSNPEVLEAAIANVDARIAATDGKGIVSISQNDNNDYCECDNCAYWDAYYQSPAGLNIWFVNQVSDRLSEKYPDVLWDTLAYTYTRKAPVGIVPNANVLVRLCTIECCFAHPLSECGHERGEDFLDIAAEIASPFAKDLEDWAKITNRLWIWNYTTNFKLLQLPHPNFHTLAGDLDWFINNSVTGVFQQGNNDDDENGEFGEMRAYILAKLLWDPNLDVEYHMMDFMKAFYGEEAAKYLKEYLDFITKKTVETAHLYCFTWPDEGMYMTAAETKKMDALWDKAEAASAGNAFQLDNIQRARLQLRLYKACWLQHEFALKNLNRKAENQKLVEDILSHGIRYVTLEHPFVMPEGLDWYMRPNEWITPEKMIWNQ